jgi:hypothetical protein
MSRLIARQPGVQRLARHPDLFGDLGHRQAVTNNRQHGLIPLLGHAQLPHPASVKDQPKQLSSISRGHTPFEVGRAGLEPATNGL